MNITKFCLSIILPNLLIAFTKGDCGSDESCVACPDLIEDYKQGKGTRDTLIKLQCKNKNIREYSCCRKNAKTENEVSCSTGEVCRNCPELIQDFKEGRLHKDALIKKRCGKREFCCPVKSSLSASQMKSTTRKPAKVSTISTPNFEEETDVNSPRFFPTYENEECGYHSDQSNIVGGNNTKPGLYPFMALIGSVNAQDKYKYRCGGTIINRWYILTAAHCYLDEPSIDLEMVNVGEYNVATDKDCSTKTGDCLPKNQIIFVQDYKFHEGFQKHGGARGVDNDIALVKLQRSILPSKMAIPICLPVGTSDELDALSINNFEDDIEGVRAHAIGWGYTVGRQREQQEHEHSIVSTDIQQAVELPILNQQQCKRFFSSVSFDSKLCAGGEVGKDSCNGDSGGPLVINKFSPGTGNLLPAAEDSVWFQVGIVSFGYRACGTGKPGVYTRVIDYVPWIRENLV